MLPPPRCESLCWRREDFYFEVGALGDGFTQVDVEVIGMQIERGRREVFMNLGFESDCFCPSLDDDLGEHNFSTPGKQYPLDTEVSNFVLNLQKRCRYATSVLMGDSFLAYVWRPCLLIAGSDGPICSMYLSARSWNLTSSFF